MNFKTELMTWTMTLLNSLDPLANSEKNVELEHILKF